MGSQELKVSTIEQHLRRSPADSCTPEPVFPEYRVYKRRWLVLTLYILFCIGNNVQWMQYAIIADVIVKYYSVDYFLVEMTSMVYMIVYLPGIFPATWLLNKKGLKLALVLGSIGNCLGAWIKVLSVATDRFWVTFIGQTIVAISQVYVLSVPSALSALWFGPKQVSTACAIGVLGSQFGNILGFLVPPLLVRNHDEINKIGDDLTVMFYSVAILTSVLLVLTLILMKSHPPTPPSAAQANRGGSDGGESPREFVFSLWRLLRNPYFMLLFLCYGISEGVFSSLNTFFNQMVLQHFPGANIDAGNIGVTFIVSGMVGTLLFGYVLDKTRKYKQTMMGVYCCSALSMVAFSFLLGLDVIALVYVTAAAVGFFMIGFMPVAFELAAEMTYPESAATSAGALTFASQVFSFVFIMVYGWVFNSAGDLASNGFLSAALVTGAVITMTIRADLRRQRAENTHS